MAAEGYSRGPSHILVGVRTIVGSPNLTRNDEERVGTRLAHRIVGRLLDKTILTDKNSIAGIADWRVSLVHMTSACWLSSLHSMLQGFHLLGHNGHQDYEK